MHRSLRPIGVAAFATLVLSLAGLIGPDPARADEEDEALEYARPGGYAMFHVMGGLEIDRRFGGADLAGGGGYILRVGSRESARLAYELAFEHFIRDGSSDMSFVYGVNAKFYFLEEAIQPYLVGGANGYSIRRSGQKTRTDWGFRVGLGVDYYVTKRWALNMEHTYVAGVGDTLAQEYGSFALGVLYRF